MRGGEMVGEGRGNGGWKRVAGRVMKRRWNR